MTTRDKIAGTLYGQAIGDAVARQTEFLPLKMIIEKFGDQVPFPHPVSFTDDTSMMLATANALPRARNRMAREYVGVLLTAFLEWNADPSNRDYSVLSNAAALDRLKTLRAHKRSWTEGTSLNTASVALTRATPVAFTGTDSAGIAQLQTALTHANPVAMATAELYVLAIQLLVDDNEPFSVLRRLVTVVNGKRNRENLYLAEWLGKVENLWSESGHAAMFSAWLRVRDVLKSVEALLGENRLPRDVCSILGNGFSADTAFAAGLYFFLRYGDNPEIAISNAAQTSGDSTAIAAVTGALCGAADGVKAWPEDWRYNVNVRNQIEKAVDGLYGMKVSS